MVFKKEEVEQCIQRIKEAKNITVVAHKSPDGDAVGSVVALWKFIQTMNQECTMVLPDAFPDFLAWIEGSEKILIADKHKPLAAMQFEETDLVFTLDFNHPSRVGNLLEEPLRQSQAFKVMIDHHRDPADYCDVVFSDVNASSTAEMVFKFIEACNGVDTITSSQAEAIYTGIITDTGSFKFPSSSAETHLIAAKLIECGCDHAKVHQLIYDSNSVNRIKLLGYTLNKMEVFESHKLAFFTLSKEELERFNVKKGDTEGFVNYALSMNGIEMAIFMKEADDIIKMSFRSKGNWWVNELAGEHFNGGGHKNAAGGASHVPLAETIEKVKNLLPNLVKYYHD